MWRLAVNLNPSGGHITHYCVSWDENTTIGTTGRSLTFDFMDKEVRLLPVNYIAIVRHNSSYPDAVKIWRFKTPNISLLSRFQSGNGSAVTEGGDFYRKILSPDPEDDPFFTVNGDIVLNYRYLDNGIRLMLSHSVNKDAADDTLPGMGVHNNLCRDCNDMKQCNDNKDHEITVYGVNKRISGKKRYAIYVISEAPFYFPMRTLLSLSIQVIPAGMTAQIIIFITVKLYI